MDYILAIFFALIGVAGLIYSNEIGVFIGLGLLPWQLIKIKFPAKPVLVVIIISLLVGTIFLYQRANWVMLAGFIFIMIYNYWGYKQQL